MSSILKYILATIVVCFSYFAGVCETNYFSARLPLYASESKLAQGHWVKIKVSKNGVYKLSFDKLRALGFKNPEKVRVFGYGGLLLSETLTSDYNDDLPEVATYLGDSYILFYGQGTIAWNARNASSKNAPLYHEHNHYSEFGSYFLSDVPGERRLVEDEMEVEDAPRAQVYTHYSPEVYRQMKVNPSNGGVDWYDLPMGTGASKALSFNFPNMVDGDNAFISMCHYIPDASKITYKMTCSSSGLSQEARAGNFVSLSGYHQSASSSVLKFNLNFTANLSTAQSYLEFFEVNALCDNKLHNGYLSFNNKPNGQYGVTVCHVAGATDATQVWYVKSPLEVTRMKTYFSNDSLQFKISQGFLRQFVAFNPNGTGFLSVDSFATIPNQNLHSLKGADLVIISPKAYFPQAQRLADLHKDFDGISSLIVTQEQIFNEFSSGVTDPTAIRAFLKMMYDRALNDESYIRPRYLLLFGDGCFDNRGVMRSGSQAPRNLVLTCQYGSGSSNYVADDYYGMLADNTVRRFHIDTCVCHVGVGRLPFINATQANQVVDKIARYMKEDNLGKWKLNTLILADDNESSQGALSGISSSYHEFVNYGEVLSRVITGACPSAIQNKMYYDSYTRVSESSGYRYPEIEKKIIDNVNSGAMYVNYIGHSNAINWSAEKTFTQSQISTLNNKKLGVWFSASCDFSEFDGYTTSCGEALVLAPNGGAIAVMATPRPTYSNENNRMDTAFTHAFFAQTPDMALGDLARIAKNNVLQTIRVKYPLMGDPALRIHFPSMRVVADSFSADTFKAMSKVRVVGHIQDGSNLVDNFNGRVSVTVFDKSQECSTKGNLLNLSTTYKDYVNTLFSGETDVIDGIFSFEFLVPNDISYAYGKGHMVFYASDDDNMFDAIGSSDDFVVGGASGVEFNDDKGPDMRTYINTAAFRSGDVVGSNPVLVVELHDENGINASGIGLGHDITVSLNGADKEIVNDYFVYNKNSFTDGKVVYPLSDLSDGSYTLEFKSWDMLGNSSLSTIHFTVKHGKGARIDDVVALNNPAKESTTVKVYCDQLLSNVSYNVDVFNLNGVRVKHFSGNEYSYDGELSFDWDLKDFSGSRVSPGVYVYKVELKTDGKPYIGASEKIVVLPQ